jgi:type II secretory pathway component PulL
MKTATFFIHAGRAVWLVLRAGEDGVQCREVPVVAKDGESDDGGAGEKNGRPDLAQLLGLLQELSYQGQEVCLGLPSELVFSAQVETADLPRKNRATALLYRLEEQLPLEAERLTADFFPPAGGRTLGVAVETRRLEPLLERLAEAGVEVANLCPTALLAAWQVLHQRQTEPPGHYLLLAGPDGWDLCRLADCQPAAWYATAREPDELVRSLNADLLAAPVEAARPVVEVLGELDDATARQIEQDAGVTLTRSSEPSVSAAAAKAAALALAGHGAGWIDLRRDHLAMKNVWVRLQPLVRAAAILGLALLLTITVLCYWRGRRYEAEARQFDALQLAAYQSVYPTGQVPPNMASRLRSEYARLSATSGEGYDVPRRQSALDNLRAIAANLPGDVRYRLTTVELSPASLLIEGQVRSHGEAERIAQALKRADLEIEPPATEQDSHGGVSFTITGKPAAARTKMPSPVTGGRP